MTVVNALGVEVACGELRKANRIIAETQATAASQSMTTEASGLNEMMIRYDSAGVAGSTTHVGSVKRPTAEPPVRVERRKATRPWANRTNKSQQPAAAPRPEAAAAPVTRVAAVADAKDSNEWQEF